MQRTDLALALGGNLSYIKFTIGYTDLTGTAATTLALRLAQQPPNATPYFAIPEGGKLIGVMVHQTTAFAGPAVTAMTVSMGLPGGSATFFTNAFDIFQAVANNTLQEVSMFKSGSGRRAGRCRQLHGDGSQPDGSDSRVRRHLPVPVERVHAERRKRHIKENSMQEVLHTFISQNPPNLGRVFYGNATPTVADGNAYVINDQIIFLPIPSGSQVVPPGTPYGWICTAAGTGATATWVPIGAGGAAFLATENGANNAIATAAGSGPLLYTGLSVRVLLAHTLQAGANTFAYNGGAALAIKSSRNTASDIGTGYSAAGIITLTYNGTLWTDNSQ